MFAQTKDNTNYMAIIKPQAFDIIVPNVFLNKITDCFLYNFPNNALNVKNFYQNEMRVPFSFRFLT